MTIGGVTFPGCPVPTVVPATIEDLKGWESYAVYSFLRASSVKAQWAANRSTPPFAAHRLAFRSYLAELQRGARSAVDGLPVGHAVNVLMSLGVDRLLDLYNLGVFYRSVAYNTAATTATGTEPSPETAYRVDPAFVLNQHRLGITCALYAALNTLGLPILIANQWALVFPVADLVLLIDAGYDGEEITEVLHAHTYPDRDAVLTLAALRCDTATLAVL